MIELDKENFDSEVFQASGKVFVDFYGDGCEPCKAIAPFIHEMADKYAGKIKFCALNTTKARRLAISQKVLGLPVIAIYENGTKIKELVKDECTEAAIEGLIKENI
jgi:thioredoxin 1